MGQTTAYSMLSVAATLDGRPVLGFFDGDAVIVEEGADVGALLVGADGSAIFSQSADRSARIRIRLQHTSPTHRQLREKERAQRAGRLVGFPFDVIDTISNEGGVADQCFIMQAPADTKAAQASVREWVLVTGDWTPNIPNNLV